IQPFGPFLFLLSGGFSAPQLLPGFAVPAITALERSLAFCNTKLGLFQTIVLRRIVAAQVSDHVEAEG
ncbi:MAG: hypothetical protein KDD44_09835, partial [Bdellovibrionales bacterium]|nr:hypothetical protein [Bdellovibrionales bacterium]